MNIMLFKSCRKIDVRTKLVFIFIFNGFCSLFQMNGGKSISPSKGDVMEACNDCANCSEWTTKGKIKALLQKNFLRMWRNVGVMLFIFALPVMQVIFLKFRLLQISPPLFPGHPFLSCYWTGSNRVEIGYRKPRNQLHKSHESRLLF